MGYNNGPRIITSGLALLLDAANRTSYVGSGTTWSDLSGNGNHCTFVNTPSWSNGVFTFNGSSNYGTITNNSTLNFAAEQTLIIVMRHSYTSGRRNPWDQAYAGYGTWTHEQGENISQYFGDGGGNNSPYIGTGSPLTPRNVWNFMCSTRNVNQQSWYINNSAPSTTVHSYGTLTTTSANITIGNGYAGYWQGDMSMILAYTRALTAVEIIQNFNAVRGRFNI
jgi:hypothetical protein